MGGSIAGAGGKRLRPMLLLLAARLAGYRGPRSIRLACVVELLHTATLIHDDVVDQAPLRRGRPSVNAQWGDDASVLVGDHLYAKSFATCCRIGALLGGVPEGQVEALTRYGLDVGVAFQISDDSLDFVADQDRLGKAIGADLREGKRTLPLIAMLERATATEAERVRMALRRRTLPATEIEEIRRLVVHHDGVEYALARAHAYAQAAKADLAPFAPSEERGTLALVADFVVDRDR